MSYVALYRKFRPQTFSQVKGQDHVVLTLTNQIKNNRAGHAYLFTGTRGTGKTSVAKIFAKAVNCLHPVDGEPCNECEHCKAIMAGNETPLMPLGTIYYYRQDYKKAIIWYTKAAEQGYGKAQNNLGSLYVQGQGIPQNYQNVHKKSTN